MKSRGTTGLAVAWHGALVVVLGVALFLGLGVATAGGPMGVGRLQFAQLNQLGRTDAGGAVDDQSRQSLPIPVRLDGPVRVAFFYAPAQPLPNVTRLAAPTRVVWLDQAGTVVRVESVTPQTYGQAVQPGELLGEYRLPSDMAAGQYLSQRERLFGLYDQLVPAGAGQTNLTPSATQVAAREFVALFTELAEPPLLPYYDALGGDFFTWVKDAAS